MILAMILFSIATGTAVWSITTTVTTGSSTELLFLIFAGFCIMGGILAIDLTPTNKDVRKGKAHYIEQNHVEVLNGDTINTYKTYQIQWIENSK